MPLFAKDPNQIIQESIATLKANTNLTSVGPGSRIRAIVELLKEEVSEAYAKFDFNTAVSFVHGAYGEYLDYLGDIFGLKRYSKQPAQTSSLAKTIRFYTLAGTFGSINSGNNVLIPAGTEIWAMKSGFQVIFYLTEPLTLIADDTEAFGTIKAKESGSFYNVPTGSIKFHGFTNYTDSADNSLLVVNTEPLENGLDDESDDNFRYRIINQYLKSMAANETAIRLAALSVPGVADVNIVDQQMGLGTMGVLIKSTTPTVSQALLNNVQEQVNNVKSGGTKIIVSAPDYLEIIFNIELHYKRTPSEEERFNAELAVKNTVVDYINNKDIGESFIINELANLVISSNPLISYIGKPGVFFNKISLYIPNGSAFIKKELIKDYKPGKIQKLITGINYSSVTFIR